jgi:hypothetical protein
MTFDNDIKLHLIFDGNRFEIEADYLNPESDPAIRSSFRDFFNS